MRDARPALILVHGAGRAGRVWRRPARRLERAYRVLAPDLPGFAAGSGRRPEETFTVDGAAAALLALAREARDGREGRENQGRPVHVVGLSLGGLVALHAAAAQPGAFTSLLVTGAPVAPGRRQADTIRRYRRVPDGLARAFSDAVSWRAVVDQLARADLRPELPDVRVPTLVVHGARDRSGLQDARLLAVGVPGARWLLLPHLGHAWPVTAPGVLLAVLAGFHPAVPGRR